MHLSNTAVKQLYEDDIKSIIKSRHICESKLEQAYDQFNFQVKSNTKSVRT